MKTFVKSAFASLVFVALIVACTRAPITGRKQVMLVSPQEMMTLSFAEYKGFMDTSKVVSTNSPDGAMVARVGGRIKKAVEDYLISNNLSHVIDGYQWEFKTVQSKELNAWCMPGGKVCFYTGILPVCKSEDGIAVVMGHEIAHAIAAHGAERMSQAMLAQGISTLGAVGVGVYAKNEQAMQMGAELFGLGTTVGMVLPNSRKQESEADKLGLIFMAMAGYNPNEAVAFWQRMAEAGKNSQKPPKMLSTHPSDEDRIAAMQKNMPKAMAYYQAYGGK